MQGPQRTFAQRIPCPKVLLYSLVVALSIMALLSAQDAFAQPADAAESPRAFHRGISESLSVASAFGSPSAPNHYVRAMSETIGVTSASPGQALQSGVSANSPKTAQHTPSMNQRGDEKLSLSFKNPGKRDLVHATAGGTQYQVLEAAIVSPSAQNFSDMQDDSNDASDPDDSSYQLAVVQSRLAAQVSVQNAATIAALAYGTLLAGTFSLAAVKSVATQRRSCRAWVVFAGKNEKNAARLSVTTVLVMTAAGSIVLAALPTGDHALADNPTDSSPIASNIDLSGAYHLDSDRNVLRDVYEESKELDGVWSGEVADGDYVRVTFEKSLTSTNDITVYPRVVAGNPRLEVYEKDDAEVIAEFPSLNSNAYNKVFLTNLQSPQDTFDLRVLGGSLEFDHIIDPAPVPTYIGDGGQASGTGTITPALPAGIQTDDVLLLFVETANDSTATSISNPNGGTWTEVTNSPQGTGAAGGTAATRLAVFWSRYNGSQGNPTVNDAGNHQIGVILAFRGVVTTGNPWDVTSGAVESTADTSGSIPGATTTAENTLVVMAIATSLPDANGTTNFSGWSNANLASVTERIDVTRAAGNGGGLGIATGEKATASAYGASSVTVGTGAAKGMMTIALRPPPPGPPTLSISQPDGVGDTISRSEPYSITYTLYDPDDDVTVAFYYDTDGSGLDGTAISGACATAPEGTDVTCEWDTTGLVAGTYYVYGIADDGLNPPVSAYSPGAVTIDRTPFFVGAGAVVGAAGAITPALPSGIEADDILLLFVETADQAVTLSDQNGGTWSEVANSPQGASAGTLATSTRLTVFWSRYNGVQGDPTVANSGNHNLGVILAFRGVTDTGDPWDVTSGNSESVSDTSLAATGATTIAANTLVVIAAALMDDAQDFGATWTNASLSNITLRANEDTAAGNDGRLGIVTGKKITAGTYGDTTNTLTGNSVKGMMTIALRPLPASRSTSDSLPVSDGIIKSASKTMSDTATIADTVTKTAVFARAISDSVTITDAAASSSIFARAAADSMDVADAATVIWHPTKALADAFEISDGIATIQVLNRSISDSLAVADLADPTFATSRAVADGVTITDEPSYVFSTSRSTSDSLATADAIQVSVSFQRSLADTLATSDTVARAYLAARSAADSLSVADSPAGTSSFARSVSDSLDTADAVKGQPVALSAADSISVADEIAMAVTRNVSDSMSVSDAAATEVMRAVSDSLSISDAIAASILLPVSESLAVGDSVSFSVTRTLSDAVAAADSTGRSADFARSLADSVDIGDSAEISLPRSVADSILVADSVSASKTFGRQIGDSLAATDGADWSIISSRAVSDGVSVADVIARAASISGAAADSLSVTDSIDVVKTYNRPVAESLAVSDSSGRLLVSARAIAEPAAISDAASTGIAAARQLADSVAASEAMTVGKVMEIGISDLLGTSDAAVQASAFARQLADSLAVGEQIIKPPIFSDRVTIADGILLSHARSLSETLQTGDGIQSSRLVMISDSLGVTSSMYVSWAGTLAFDESISFADGQCLPGYCIHNLVLGESLAMQDRWISPPDLHDSIAVTDAVNASIGGNQLFETLSIADRATTLVKLVPPAVPAGWGLTEMPAVNIAGSGTPIVQPAAPPLLGTYDASGGVATIVQQTGMPDYDVGPALAATDMSDQTMVIPMFRVSMNPSADLPARNGLLSPVVTSIPANTKVSVPVDIGATVGAGVVHPIDWMTLNYTPAAPATDFSLLVSMLDSQPAGAQALPDDVSRFYLDVRWTGTFAGAERPSDSSFYAVRPTFTFAITEEWATQERMARDANGVPMLSLSLLNESTGQWEAANAITRPLARVGGLYEYTVQLEHLSTYAVTANTTPASVGSGTRPEEEREPSSYNVGIADSLQVQDQLRAVPIEVTEEPGTRAFTARLVDSLAVRVQQAAVKTFVVGDKVDVTIRVQSVGRTSIIPPLVEATFLVDVTNRGQEWESFELLFSYHDQSGKIAYSSSRLVEVGPLEKTRFTLEIPFDSPGMFQVSIEARSVPEGKLLSTSQQLVEVPWLEVNLYILIIAVMAVLGGSAAALLYVGPRYFKGVSVSKFFL